MSRVPPWVSLEFGVAAVFWVNRKQRVLVVEIDDRAKSSAATGSR